MSDGLVDVSVAKPEAPSMLMSILGLLGGIALAILMLITVVDVLARAVSGISVIGAYELTELTIGVVVALGMPLVALNSSHLTVDLLQGYFKGRILAVKNVLTSVLTTGAELFLAWCLYRQALRSLETGGRTAMLEVPLAPVLFVLAVLFGLAGLITLGFFLRGVFLKEEAHH